MRHLAILIIVTLSIHSFCYGQDTYTYSQPKELGDGWKTSDLKSQNVDTTLIYKLFNQLKDRENQIHSVLLVKNDQLIIEEYFKGQSVNDAHDLRSTTKSIRSILMGIAIDKGFIESIDDPISKYLKNPIPNKNLDERKEKITIKHLLTMSSGLDCNDFDRKSKGQEDKIYRKKDWLQYALDLPMVNEPGGVSNYCSIGTVLIAEIVSQASGMPIDKFAEQYLFNPLGITNVEWGHTSKKEVIPSAKRLYMRSRDMAKIGQLILNNGKWNDTQIISKKWVEESTSTKTKIEGIDYAYLWWNIPFKLNDKILVSKTASGNGGQFIIIIPEMDMVAVFTGGAYNSQDGQLAFAIMNDIFLPTFTSRK
ncbi:serine hydrolase domain-containing protein [Ulvibacter antarcticus]|uniref:CubicO group peptidase (Beta-lactamase class C family) n=1 Tax=Ulvibacter antarcticus TaxID=442714 RepID=A0A3L9Z091_9FLAO|nr:serine hydrolase [Ulvibacter antarcticus]RMA64789.1 CubicO group peptidase (beta-lactamase class C family) [Ulvibacter antarcticus]